MKIKYFLHKRIGKLWDIPIIPHGRTVGYSFIRSEKANVFFGKYSKVYPPFFLHDIRLGDYSYISRNACIKNCEIGKFCSIGPNFCCGLGIHPTGGISTSPMFYSTKAQNGIALCDQDKIIESKITYIGNDVFIGANVTVLDGVHIGDGAVIGAGAVVVDDIPAYAIAVGVPAKVHKYRFDKCTIDRLLAIKWWDSDEARLQDVEKFFFDIDGFLNQTR